MREEPIKEQRTRDSDALRAACGREGCPVCTVALEYLDRFIENWEYEGFSDVAHRYELINSRGFCPLHTWQLAQRSNGFRLGLKTTTADLLLPMTLLRKVNRYSKDGNEHGFIVEIRLPRR